MHDCSHPSRTASIWLRREGTLPHTGHIHGFLQNPCFVFHRGNWDSLCWTCSSSSGDDREEVGSLAPALVPQLPSADFCGAFSLWQEQPTIQSSWEAEIRSHDCSWLKHCWDFSSSCHWKSPQKEELRHLVQENREAFPAVQKVARTQKVHSPQSQLLSPFHPNRKCCRILQEKKKGIPREMRISFKSPSGTCLSCLSHMWWKGSHLVHLRPTINRTKNSFPPLKAFHFSVYVLPLSWFHAVLLPISDVQIQ